MDTPLPVGTEKVSLEGRHIRHNREIVTNWACQFVTLVTSIEIPSNYAGLEPSQKYLVVYCRPVTQ